VCGKLTSWKAHFSLNWPNKVLELSSLFDNNPSSNVNRHVKYILRHLNIQNLYLKGASRDIFRTFLGMCSKIVIVFLLYSECLLKETSSSHWVLKACRFFTTSRHFWTAGFTWRNTCYVLLIYPADSPFLTVFFFYFVHCFVKHGKLFCHISKVRFSFLTGTNVNCALRCSDFNNSMIRKVEKGQNKIKRPVFL